jgi:4-amino-4-deoxy-L-arabinose transferase-like glycosyltransferase
MMEFLGENQWLFFLMSLWVLPWKGVALWKAARADQKKWFVALLLLNTLAILEILYIFVFSKKKGKEGVKS